MKYRNCLILALPFLLISCQSSSLGSIGMYGAVGLFGLMFILFASMFFLIARRKKKGEKSLVKFNNDIYLALNKLDTPEQKANMLEVLIQRINNDEKYKKDIEWRDKVLLKAYLHLATAYHNMGDETQTLNTCTKIIEIDPKDEMAFYNRGSIYSNMGLYEKALKDLSQAIDINPDNASAYNNRGLVREKMEHYEEALEDFSKAIEKDESLIAYLNRGNTYFELKNYEKALEDYKHIVKSIEDENSDLKKEALESIRIVETKL